MAPVPRPYGARSGCFKHRCYEKGRKLVSTRAPVLVDGLRIRVLTEDGELIRELTLDPSRDYQPTVEPETWNDVSTYIGAVWRDITWWNRQESKLRHAVQAGAMGRGTKRFGPASRGFPFGVVRALRLRTLAQTWDSFGESDPMWAVLTHPEKEGGRWDPDAFFESGREQVQAALDVVAELGWALQHGTALDFGSGVGRLTQALCEHFEVVKGVDIAESMIKAAERLNRFPERCTYHLNLLGDLSLFPEGSFDFVYSTYVLQHIASDLARGYVEEFVRVLAPGGVALFQMPTTRISGRSPSLWVRARRQLTPRVGPQMQMYATPARIVEGWIASAGGHLLGEVDSPPDEEHEGFLFAATRAFS